jgi:alkaline phosphatase D
MKYIVLLVLLVLSACSSVPRPRTDKLSILQGVTSNKEVEFNIVAAAGRNLRFELRSAAGAILSPEESQMVSRPDSAWVVHKMLFLRDQAQDYNLYVYENTKIVDQRLVGKGQLNQSKLRLAVMSCMDDEFDEHFKIWKVLMEKNPEYILMIGDNFYADKNNGIKINATAESIWQRYIDGRLSIPFYFQEKLIPVHALWDDHDYGQGDGNEEFKLKDFSKDIFDAMWAQSLNDEIYAKGFGVGGLLSMGDFNLYFLDGRSFRAVHKDGRHLGKDQEQWLMKSLKEESQPSFIIKGDQFFGGYSGFESYEGNHPQDFERFVADLKALGTPFIFLSGDRHMSEIMQFPRSLFGLPSFEITSSPMHGKTYDPASVKNPWRVVAVESKTNFTMIDNLARDNHWFLEVESIGENGEVFYRRELAVFIKDLQNNLKETRKRREGSRRYRRSQRSKSRGRRR